MTTSPSPGSVPAPDQRPQSDHVSDTATWVVNTIGAALMVAILVSFLGLLVSLAARDGTWLLIGMALGVFAAAVRLLNAVAPRPVAEPLPPSPSAPARGTEPDEQG